jgi:predicted O-methyltransferase YrrM
MSQELWTSVDNYLSEVLVRQDKHLADAVAARDAAGLPSIQVSPPQGKLLEILIQMMGAKSILEVGTLGGYSTIWMARALPSGGRVVTIEIDPKHAQVAEENFDRAGLGDVIELKTGNARDILPAMVKEGAGPFDFVFIDADKASYDAYYERCLQLLRPGGLIAIDNTLWGGKVAHPAAGDADTAALQALNAKLHGDARVDVSLLPIGDGLTLARKR